VPLTDNAGVTHNSQDDIVRALCRRSSPTNNHSTPLIFSSPRPYVHAKSNTLQTVHQALSRTKNSSTPGPDGIHYRLIKLIKDTPLGQALLNDMALTCDLSNPEPEHTEQRIVMIPKPGNDHSLIKSWRPSYYATRRELRGEIHSGPHPETQPRLAPTQVWVQERQVSNRYHDAHSQQT